ncbi:TonB-dependent receptor [Prevotella sp. HUN102]|uniref:SusC/RagA family TonB-linked outer membrane protein n=1 Tax=Prevotella sp. HUN102 TaxID=1392486 RepID=UPI00048C1E15|nr:TonB-dependent receptor [Prevotella sp. HUN102]
MKQVKCKFPVRMLAFVAGIFLSISAFAQTTVNGHVKDAAGDDVIGASVLIEGTADGTTTDIDGNFSLNVQPGARLKITYIGYQAFVGAAVDGMEVVLQPDQQQIEEVVVIGYGVAKKSDLTGSVLAMKPDAKNKGVVVNAQDMMQGKMAGVNVTSDGGTPGGGAQIRIRGGSSLNASNSPLIVIDGVAMDNTGIKGMANPLSMVNPQDIESFNVLKDASATAIYGSRGSNGVIIITTKKGRSNQPLSVSYAGSVTASMKKKDIDVMTGDQYREFITNLFGAGSPQVAALGTANTDWQDEIYRTAWSHDHNLTVSGAIGNGKNALPFRASVGYTNNQGILRTSQFERYTAALNLNPSLLDNHLNVNIALKGMFAKNRYADGAAIGSAVGYDPSQSIYDHTSPDAANFGFYHTWRGAGLEKAEDPNWPSTFNTLATKNPLAILNLKNDRAHSRDFIGNAEVDYKIHGFEDLRLHATVGADIAAGQQDTDIDPTSPLASYYGYTGWSRQLKRNLTFNTYAQYYHDFNDKYNNHFDIMAGYEWQHFWHRDKSNSIQYYPSTNLLKAGQIYKQGGKDYNGDGVLEDYVYATENYLVSFFGRANWSLMDRYYLTATVRADGASRFKDHWATFPSLAFAWKVKDENAFKNINWLSDLKFRLGWGMTGQQEGIGDYSYFDIYQMGSGTNNFYPITGDGTVARPQAVNKNLTWETTTTYNLGLDWGVANQRLTGSLDWYFRKTTDLLNTVYVPAGSNFRNQVSSNIGSLTNTGVEVALSWKAIQAKDFYWTLDYNFTYNHNKITDLTGGSDANYFIPTGGISAGTGGNAQAHAVGHPMSSFYVYQQVYDKDGKAIEGAVVDRNADGQITEADKYFYKSPNAPVTMGLSSRMDYKGWDFGFTLRASLGNYVFNDMMAGNSNVSAAAIWASSGFMSNRPVASLADNWQTGATAAILSDRWVQNASFLKLDNVTLGYSFADLFKTGNWRGLNGRVYGTASNILTITNYDGIDPEVFGGIDNNLYPRPISFILGLNLNF